MKSASPAPLEARISCRLVRSMDDVLRALAVRAAVYIAEEACPYEEEYDGNDFCAAHFLGFAGAEPAGTLRIRFFSQFAKFERLAVRSEHRGNGLANLMIEEAKAYCRRKGFRKLIAHARQDRVSLWSSHGFAIRPNAPAFVFSDYSYAQVSCVLAADPVARDLESDPYRLIRPENAWDRPGILEASAARPTRSKLSRKARAHAA